jgi:putative hydrolase
MSGNDDTPEQPDWNEDDLRDAFRRFLEGGENFDPGELMRAAGIDVTAPEMQQMMAQLGNAFGSGGLLSATGSKDHAMSVAQKNSTSIDPNTAEAVTQAANIANLWLSEVVEVAELGSTPLLATRVDWARKTMSVWEEITEPVAVAIPRAVAQLMASQAPEELGTLFSGAKEAMEKVGTSLFGLQLAQVVGKLSEEVISGGDIGIPLVHGSSEYDVQAVLIPQNMRAFSAGLDTPVDEADIFLAVREIAHARLFRHARWLRLGIMGAIRDFASGISIDSDRIMRFAEDFDPTDTEALRDLVASGKLLPERTENQNRALQRLETLLALIEGWVDLVTRNATTRLPKAEALGEAMRRRRASGGPSEHAFATLVGLELRPRRLREASALWEAITHAVGPTERDALWEHPDRLPRAEDVDDPEGFLHRLKNPVTHDDDMDKALRDLLDGEKPSD